MIDIALDQSTEEAGDRVVPMSELIGERVYARYLESKPALPPHMRNKRLALSPPWVVYVQKRVDGPWGKREFWKYKKALQFFHRALELGVHDAALNCKRYAFEPPIQMARIRGKYVRGSDGKRRQATTRVYWKLPLKLQIDQPEHEWCMYCRRPTVFKYYSRHKRLGTVTQDVRRCCICGSSEKIALMPRGRKP